MTLEIAKDAVDWLYNNNQIKINKGFIPINSKPRINFFGGEPTLLWDEIIVPLTKYIRTEYYNNFQIGMTSNCTLLDEERINFLYKNNIGLLLSMDGDRETQELTRPCKNCSQSSFDLIMNNLPMLLKYYPNLTFRATVNTENVAKMFENYLFAEKNGFQNFFFSPNEREKWPEEKIQILELQVEKICYHQLLYFLNGYVPRMGSSLIDTGFKQAISILHQKNNLLKEEEYNDIGNRCGLGTNFGSINYEGKIFGCQEQDSRNFSNSIFYVGDIYNGVNPEKQLNLLKQYYKDSINRQCENIEICKNCKNIISCRKDCCPSTSMDVYNNFRFKSEVQCRYKNAFTNNALTIIKILAKQDNPKFEYYLNNLSEISEKRHYHGFK